MATIEGRVGASINRSVIMPTQDSIAVIERTNTCPINSARHNIGTGKMHMHMHLACTYIVPCTVNGTCVCARRCQLMLALSTFLYKCRGQLTIVAHL